MIFHIHFSYLQNSGEIRRIKNINKDLAFRLSNDVIEIAFISIFHFIHLRKYKFLLNEEIKHKYYIPVLPFSYGKYFFKALNSFWVSFCLLIIYLLKKPSYIIGEFSIAWQALRFIPKHTKCIIDVHGATREEYDYSTSGKKHDERFSRYFDFLEERGMKRAVYVVCQSTEMKRFLLKKYPFLKEEKLYVYKCSADSRLFFYSPEIRQSMRKQLELEKSQKLFIYSGGLHKWQRFEDTLKFFSNYKQQHPNSKYLILTLNKEEALSIIENKYTHLINDCIVKSVDNKEVHRYLNAADIAFLLRDNVIMNAVASPTKLSEYLCCGLPIISSQVAKKWIDNDKFIFYEDFDIKTLDSFLENVNREDIATYAKEMMTLETDRKQMQLLINNERAKQNHH